LTAHGEAVARGEIDNPVGDREVLRSRPVAHPLPLHLILRHDRRAFAQHERGEIVLRRKLCFLHSTAVEDALGCREVRKRRRCIRFGLSGASRHQGGEGPT
jgi:hypothetical protein